MKETTNFYITKGVVALQLMNHFDILRQIKTAIESGKVDQLKILAPKLVFVINSFLVDSESNLISIYLPNQNECFSGTGYLMESLTPIQYAVYLNKVEIIDYLLNLSYYKSFSFNKEEKPTEEDINELKISLLESRNAGTKIPLLQEAIYCGNVDVVKYLMKELLKLNIKIDEEIISPFYSTPLFTTLLLYNSCPKSDDNEKEKYYKIYKLLLNYSDPFNKVCGVYVLELTLKNLIDEFDSIMDCDKYSRDVKREFIEDVLSRSSLEGKALNSMIKYRTFYKTSDNVFC